MRGATGRKYREEIGSPAERLSPRRFIFYFSFPIVEYRQADTTRVAKVMLPFTGGLLL
jgi:hypothetical protein